MGSGVDAVPSGPTGSLLHAAAAAWDKRFAERMRELGYGWYGEARGQLLLHVGADGVTRSELTACSGLGRRELQKYLDELVVEGVISISSDTPKARQKYISYTVYGASALKEAEGVRRSIEHEFEKLLGKRRHSELQRQLTLISGI